jgi:hypothetical protein
MKDTKFHSIYTYPLNKVLVVSVIAVSTIVLAAYFIFNAVISRPHLNNPVPTFYQLRMQLVIDNNMVNFSENSFQVSSNDETCSETITKEPFYVAKNKSQLIKVRWEGLTGGEIIKYFGLNYIGGFDDILGFRFDAFPAVSKINTHGKNLNIPKKEDNMYIYKGNRLDYTKVTTQDFLYKDLELILKKSKIRQKHDENKVNRWFDNIFVSAEGNNEISLQPQYTDGQLNEINDLIGNIVVFIQDQEPTSDQVADRFANLEPLDANACT